MSRTKVVTLFIHRATNEYSCYTIQTSDRLRCISSSSSSSSSPSYDIYINIFIYETAASGRGKTSTTGGKNYTFLLPCTRCFSFGKRHGFVYAERLHSSANFKRHRFYILGNFKISIFNTAKHRHAAGRYGRFDKRLTRIQKMKKYAPQHKTRFRSCVESEKCR